MLNIKKILRLFGRKPVSQQEIILKIEQQLEFKKSAALTLGIECELGLVRSDGFLPSATALDIIKALDNPHIHHEARRQIIEMTTAVCTDVHQAKAELQGHSDAIAAYLEPLAVSLLGMGTMPRLTPDQAVPVVTERYEGLIERRRILCERFFLTMGMHLHIGVTSAASCIRYHNFYMHFLPHILALGANSPFENGTDTGLQSIRPTMTEAMPIAGLPYQFKNWNDYRELCLGMARAGSIGDLKDLWWDLRPCPRYGTLEIRLCDQPATLAEAMAITAFVHCMGYWFEEHQGWLDEMPRPSSWRMRDNKWRAMRYGLDAQLILDNNGSTRSITDDLLLWVERLQPFYDKMGYQTYQKTLLDMLQRGNGAARQKRVFATTGNLDAVYAHAIAEWKNGSPLWDRIDDLERTAERGKIGPLVTMTDEEWLDPANKGCCA